MSAPPPRRVLRFATCNRATPDAAAALGPRSHVPVRHPSGFHESRAAVARRPAHRERTLAEVSALLVRRIIQNGDVEFTFEKKSLKRLNCNPTPYLKT